MAHLLLLTNTLAPSAEVVPALGLLSHHVRILPAEGSALVDAPQADVVLVDARRELAMAKSLCRVIVTTGSSAPLLVVVTEGGLAGITSDWGIDDVILDTAGPAEVEARLRLALGRTAEVAPEEGGPITAGALVIDEATYSVRLRGRLLDLTYKEFELLKYLAQHPGRVFTRSQLLQEVWGYDYFGGTRTVDVHVGGCARSSAPTTRCSSAPCATSGTASSPRSPTASPRSRAEVGRTERVVAVDASTADALRGLWSRAAEADGVGAVSEAFRLAVGPEREGVVHLLRRSDDDGRSSGTPRSPRPGPPTPSPARRRPRPPAAWGTGGPSSTRHWPRAPQRLVARDAPRRRGPGVVRRAVADPQAAPDEPPAHRGRPHGSCSAAGLLG